jgi:hypothetical protein
MTATDIYRGQKFREVQTMNETYHDNATFFRKGRYLEQLQAFTRVFKRSQIMILSSDGLFKNTTAIMEKIRKFIGVERDETFTRSLPHGERVTCQPSLTLTIASLQSPNLIVIPQMTI